MRESAMAGWKAAKWVDEMVVYWAVSKADRMVYLMVAQWVECWVEHWAMYSVDC